MRTLSATALGFLFVGAVFSAPRDIPSVSSPVIDETRTLTIDQSRRLESLIRSSLPAVQIQIWIVSSLQGETIESLSIRAADRWKLGTEKKDNGLVILVAKEDRAVRIEVGQGLEGVISDLIARRIVDRILIPNFREQKTYVGLRDAILAIDDLAAGGGAKTEALTREGSERELSVVFWFIILLLFGASFVLPVFMAMAGIRGVSRGSGWRGPSNWGGGGGFGGFGGGGWSGGGGGFSGGGASGRW